MLASEYIKTVQALIEQHGDCEIVVEHVDTMSHDPVTTVVRGKKHVFRSWDNPRDQTDEDVIVING